MSNIFRFPGAPDPTPEPAPQRPTNADPFALINEFGRALIARIRELTGPA